MLEKALSGSKRYWIWVTLLLAIIAVGFVAYMNQFNNGLGVTGMSRDVSWGLYIAQFTFLVGVAASAVMLVLPYYLHDFKKFGKMVILGEFLAIPAVIMCMLFIVVDLGQPMRIMNVILHPSPHSVMFYDMIVLCGYLLINLVVGWTTLGAERKGAPSPKWVKPIIYLSIPWAVSIHTVTAFLYAGLPGRHLWLSAIMAARFLASAFAAGPAILILLCFIVKKVSKFDPDPGVGAIQSLVKIVRYAMIANVFFYILELFTAFYSNIPEYSAPLRYIFFGMDGHYSLVPIMWTAVVLAFLGIAMLVFPSTRMNKATLIIGLLSIIIANWIDKGMILIVAGFVPNSFERVIEYAPTLNEILVTLAVYSIGMLLVTILYKVAISVREEKAN
ncbi:sulfate reduction electron transfer complex DsrMKJOP subunit DsrP [Desulfosporosinus hippei]|uniref:Prokaryotic molybdopterin-containing oxidoreductase family, membrane subunit n=1 Tax=Desulfosporosinus hippei DSM 8344 TaxID=1121419 RepID=A0A1G8ENI5_9FIRM|nr:NrfD/PsrC family molybdoenzyme membrane anchor subunit [Desulfosporosinus hippei]SDH71405.1 prokaryotic molybdopterin-containing oxidoreductase family, membrane subunit [Desulfosporosinus hippei DSM 8344]